MPRLKKYVTFSTKIPICWPIESLDDYDLWRESALAAPPHPKSSICEDCTPEYQAKMIEQKKCENPEIIFEIDNDGFLAGRLPRHRDFKKPPKENKDTNELERTDMGS